MKYLCFAAVFLSTQVSATPELKGNPDELRKLLHPSDRIVLISASAEETAYADKAILSLAITTEESTLSRAISKNDALRESIATQLQEAGIVTSNIRSSKFSMSPQYGWFGKSPNSFKIVNRMAITIFETNTLKAVAEIADQREESTLIDTSFHHTAKDELQGKVKKLALKKVLNQKTIYEEALSVKLKPVAFREGQIYQAPTRGAQLVEEAFVSSARSNSFSSKALAPQQPAVPSFDEIKYNAEITVEFIVSGTASASP